MYVKIIDNIAKKYNITDLRLSNPGVLFPETPSHESLLEYNVFPLTAQIKPDFDDSTQIVEEIDPILIDNNWTQQWQIRNLTEEELQNKIPLSVTRLQARLALIEFGIWSNIVTYFSDTNRTETELAFWEDAQNWYRNDPIVISAGNIMGLNKEQLNYLFIRASEL